MKEKGVGGEIQGRRLLQEEAETDENGELMP
jgi:hypothetical protein